LITFTVPRGVGGCLPNPAPFAVGKERPGPPATRTVSKEYLQAAVIATRFSHTAASAGAGTERSFIDNHPG